MSATRDTPRQNGLSKSKKRPKILSRHESKDRVPVRVSSPSYNLSVAVLLGPYPPSPSNGFHTFQEHTRRPQPLAGLAGEAAGILAHCCHYLLKVRAAIPNLAWSGVARQIKNVGPHVALT